MSPALVGSILLFSDHDCSVANALVDVADYVTQWKGVHVANGVILNDRGHVIFRFSATIRNLEPKRGEQRYCLGAGHCQPSS
jgi:hypothetical protein